MLRKTIKYTNLDGETVEEDFYFHLNKADLAKMMIEGGDGFEESLRAMIAAKDVKQIVAEFEKIIRLAYGRRSEDGKEFIRSSDLSDRFIRSEAYSELFMELFASGPEASAAFIRDILPKDMASKLTTEMAIVELPEEDTRPLYQREHRKPTKAEVRGMSRDELLAAMQYGQNLSE